MSEENTSAEQQPAEEKQTLEQLYDEYNVQQPENNISQVAQQPETEQQPAGNDQAAVLEEIRAFRAELHAEKEANLARAETQDFNNAVAELEEATGLKGKTKLLRGFLLGQAHEDSRLRLLWEKRHTNKSAWNKAISIIADEAKKEFAVEDPQLEENQRAMEESQRTQGTAKPPAQKSREQQILEMNPADFDRAWRKLAGRG